MFALPLQRFLFTLAAIMCCPGLVQAGAWVQPEDDGLLILNHSFYTANTRFDNDGKRRAINTYNKYEFNPYVEYGLTNRLSIGASLSLQAASQADTAGQWIHIDLGDSEFFAKGSLYNNGKIAISTTGLIKLPSPHIVVANPPIGSNHPDIGVGLSAGYGFPYSGKNHFVDASALYRYRFGAPNDQVNLSATYGLWLNRDFLIMPQAFATLRMKEPDFAAFTQSPGDDYNELKLQLSGVYVYSPITSFQGGVFATVYGENTGIGKGVLFSIWRKF